MTEERHVPDDSLPETRTGKAPKGQPRKINPMVKMGLELGPIILFFIAYILVRDKTFVIGGREYDGFIVVTAGFIPLILICTAILWKLTGHLSKMQIVTAVLITVFGGLSVWLNDERFFKMKPTLIYLIFGGALAIGLWREESYLEAVLGDAMPMKQEGWMILTKRLCLFFFALAILNEIIWRTQSTDIWVYFKTFGLSAAVFLFFLTQGKVIQTYGIDRDEDPEADG